MGLFVSARPVDECPGRTTLVDFDLGRLPAPELDAVSRHVSSCDRCEAILHALQGQDAEDRVIARLKQCLNGPPPPNGPACAGMESLAETALVTAGTQERTARDEDL